MKDKAEVRFNPLKIFVISLVFSFLIGEIINKNIPLPITVNICGLFLLIVSCFIFFVSVRTFFFYKEKLSPSTPTEKIIKTGIYSYIRNPIYLAFIWFQISMFLLFENVIYLLSSILLFIWIVFFVVEPEEVYLHKKFGKEYEKYSLNVSRWFFF